jgi:hypothetical protein
MPRSVMVFSHPNHEIAVLGTIYRKRPDIIFLTDGGGEDRVDQSRQGLSAYLQEDSLHFLNYTEQSLYDALIRCDVAFYRSLASEVRDLLMRLDAEEVFCDAVEFYNPVHDIALPVVLAALGGRDIPLYEVPLIHQSGASIFQIQRAPRSLAPLCVWVDLTPDESARKMATVTDGIYKILFDQMGGMITEAIPTHARREQFLRARRGLPEPAPDQALRYDERGAALKSAGTVKDEITYRQHYVPVFVGLVPA